MKQHVTMTANMTAQTFTTHPLTGKMALQAYPLIQVVRGDLSLEAWTAFVQTHAWDAGDVKDEGRGIIALMNALGYLQGLFSYHVRNALAAGPVLEVENVVVMDMFKPAGAAEALRRSMQDLVCRHQCNCLHVVVDQADAWLRTYFNDLGFQMEKVHYCSRLRPDIGGRRPKAGDRTGRRGGLRLI